MLPQSSLRVAASPLFLSLLKLALFSTSVLAGNGPLGSNCSVSNNRLDHNTHAFIDDCDARGYCAGTNTCLPKQCRSDEFPFGFGPGELLPPMCAEGQYCPDEESGCLPLIPVGGVCQLNRDDQCQPPPLLSPFFTSSGAATYHAGPTAQVEFNATGGMPRALNSICLRGICTAANITLNQPCQTDETVYVGYTPANVAFTNVVSRDNCIGPGLYCDATRAVCLQAKQDGERCVADKECESYNCNAQMMCVAPPEAPLRVGAWGYAVVALVIVITIVLLVVCLWKVHKSGSAKKRAELDEYYKEQLAYRTSILSLQSAVAALPPLVSHHHLSKQLPPAPLPPHRAASRSRSHHSMKNPYDPSVRHFDAEDDDRLSFEEDTKEKFSGGYEPEPLAYGYGHDDRRDGRGGGRGTYEDWEEVDLQQQHHGRR